MLNMWDCGFNSSDGPKLFDSGCMADELDIIELGYCIMAGMSYENDYGIEHSQLIIHNRTYRANTP